MKSTVEKLENGMPSLNHLPLNLRSGRFLGSILGVSGPEETRGRLIVDGLARHVEKAVREYERTRLSQINFAESGEFDSYVIAQESFEFCVLSLHKGLGYLQKLRRRGFKNSDGSIFIQRPRDLEILRNVTIDQVRAFRDRIEHIDEDIINGAITDPERVGVTLRYEYALIGDDKLEFKSVARWIGQLYRYPSLLSKVHFTTTPSVR